jgi:hypothetical protein
MTIKESSRVLHKREGVECVCGGEGLLVVMWSGSDAQLTVGSLDGSRWREWRLEWSSGARF